LLFLLLVTGGLYPALVTLAAQTAFPTRANGSPLLDREGHVVGAALVGQFYHSPTYFWGRPSATAEAPANALRSGASNVPLYAPTTRATFLDRLTTLQIMDQTNVTQPPIDLVTASGSGLDPDISPAAAAYQIARVARQRGLDEAAVQALVDRETRPRLFGFLGEPRVNVLRLNLALDGKI
jgi:K+-transporting ATPase ATPase C chain